MYLVCKYICLLLKVLMFIKSGILFLMYILMFLEEMKNFFCILLSSFWYELWGIKVVKFLDFFFRGYGW